MGGLGSPTSRGQPKSHQLLPNEPKLSETCRQGRLLLDTTPGRVETGMGCCFSTYACGSEVMEGIGAYLIEVSDNEHDGRKVEV
jgi:hypothetical protein